MMARNLLVPTLIAAALTATAGPARADFDKQLLREVTPVVIKYLEEHGYQNVGVLKFRVQRGTEPPTFNAGALNQNLATRLENALILQMKKDRPLGVLDDPGAVAAQVKQRATYLSPEGRQQFFTRTYPLRWGTERVKPDAFLTGLAKVDFAQKKVTVTIEAFDATAADLAKVTAFEAPLDRTVLADAGAGFVLPAAKVKSLAPNVLNDLAASAAGQPASGDLPVQVTVLYNNEAQALKPLTAGGTEYGVAEPRPKQALQVQVKNLTGDRIAVVVLVNGENTIFRQRNRTAETYRRWILDGHELITIDGFYNEGDTKDPFGVLTDPETLKLLENEELAKDLGKIEVFVFREGQTAAAPPPPPKEGEAPAETPPTTATGTEEQKYSIGMRARPSQRPPSLTEARVYLTKNLTPSMGAIVADETKRTEGKLQVVPALKNAQLVANLSIRYFQPAKKISE